MSCVKMVDTQLKTCESAGAMARLLCWGYEPQNVWDIVRYFMFLFFMGNVTGLFVVSYGFLRDVFGYWDKMEYSKNRV